jgi:hypothetical protein
LRIADCGLRIADCGFNRLFNPHSAFRIPHSAISGLDLQFEQICLVYIERFAITEE